MKRLSLMACAAALALLVLAGAALAGSVKLPPYREQALPNGLKVFVMEIREVPLVTVSLVVPAGSAMDDPGAEGIANLTGRLLLKGAGGMTAEQIAESIEEVGGSIRCRTGRDYTGVYANFMAKDLERAVDMLAKAALAPGFPEEELVREKALLAAEIAGTKDNPMAFASREFIRALAGSHPYAHPVEGSEESVGALTREKVLAFYRASYVPRGAVLAVVGDVDAKKALELVKARFGGWKGEAAAKSIPALEPKPYPGRRVLVVDKADATQSQIRFGNVTVQRGTSEEFPLVVSNTVLGGGFTSRLMDEIRVNRGLSYGARSTNSNFKHGGIFGVYTYTKNASLRECVDVALEQVERMRTEKLTNAELSSAKKYITGLFPFDVETNGDLANWLVDLTFYGIPLSYVEEYGSKIDAVSADDCLAAARKRYWRDDNLMFLMTKYDETKPQLEGLGKIEVVNIADVK